MAFVSLKIKRWSSSCVVVTECVWRSLLVGGSQLARLLRTSVPFERACASHQSLIGASLSDL